VTFQDFNFNEQLLEGVLSMGYTKATPIQEMTIPVIMNGDDLIACAQTGTGKTASYLLPVLNFIANANTHQTTALVLAPTRELAQQIDQQVEGLAYFTGISSQAVFGGGDGMAYEQQRRGIQNSVNIIIATPGRLIAHLTSGVLKLTILPIWCWTKPTACWIWVSVMILCASLATCPKNAKRFCFRQPCRAGSVTWPKAILTDPQQINIAISQPAAGIDQQVYRLHDGQKTPLLKMLLKDGGYLSSIIFASRKEIVKSLYKELKQAHLNVAAFHSDLQQNEREEISAPF
jgi:ATP-dependent RNA helicase RhlE